MARYSQQSFDFYQQSPSALDSKAAFSEEDEMSVLDDKILDSTTPDLSSMGDPRRTSYDQAAEGFSHRDPVWTDFPQPASNPQSRQNSQMSNSMFDSASNAFMRLDASQAGTNYAQQTSYSGSCIPAAVYEPFPQEFDGNSATAFSGGAVGPVNSISFPQMTYRPGTAFAAPAAVTMSPQSSQGWMPPATSEAQENRPRPARSSPITVRRDGIRKKNARFEIPAERTLSNIDQLIAQSTNEEEIKELKQQKRLLRNRQAALDSRQRKKLHTEKLEEEKKHFTNVIAELEEALHNMKMREAELLREKGEWLTAQQQINQYIEGLHMEKDELIRTHTLETAELRKKNNILREAVERLESQLKASGIKNNSSGSSNESNNNDSSSSSSSSNSATSTTFSSEFTDFENLTVDNSPWEDFSMVNSLSLDTEPVSSSTADNSMLVVSNKADKASEKPSSRTDYPFSWNAFYMCLLFGAFIASNSSSFSSSALPKLSEEYRAESANVLKAVLAAAPPETSQTNSHGPVSSSTTAQLPTTISGAEMAQMTSGAGATSSLDELHNTLAMPTKEQEHEQVFSLNPDQYNALTTFEDDDVDFKPQQPSNLQQALTAMRNHGAQHKLESKATSDVYSRSLLWDRIPEKVVRDFRKMVRECGVTALKEEGNCNSGQN